MVGSILEVDRKENLSEKDFIHNYFNKNKPVIFNGEAADWTCCTKWNIDYIKTHFPERLYNVLEWPNESELANQDPGHLNSGKKISKVSGSDLVDMIHQGKKIYLRGCPILEENPGLISDLELSWLAKMQRCFFGVSFQSFISSGNVEAPMHNESTSFFFIMVEGEKKWTLFPADNFSLINPVSARIAYNFSNLNVNNLNSENYPGINLLDRYTCVVKKGDVLFVPAWMWHAVKTTAPSWAVSYKYTSLRSFLSSWTFALNRLLIAKPNIFETLYCSFFKTDMGSREKNLLIPKLFINKSSKR